MKFDFTDAATCVQVFRGTAPATVLAAYAVDPLLIMLKPKYPFDPIWKYQSLLPLPTLPCLANITLLLAGMYCVR